MSPNGHALGATTTCCGGGVLGGEDLRCQGGKVYGFSTMHKITEYAKGGDGKRCRRRPREWIIQMRRAAQAGA